MDSGTDTVQQDIGQRGAERKPEQAESEPAEPRVFIIHAGEDKESIARPLVSALHEQGLDKHDIFFDEHSIKPGEGIRDRIVSTLKSDALELAVIVVSTSFLKKDYWPKLEFETCLENNKRILPIWVDDNQDDFKAFSELVGKYSPTLKQRKAIRVQRNSVADELTNLASQIRKCLPPPAIQALAYLQPTGTPSSHSGSSDEEIGIGRKRRYDIWDGDEEVIEKKLKEEKTRELTDLQRLHAWGTVKIDLLKKAGDLLSKEEIKRQVQQVLLEIDKAKGAGINILKVKSGCAIIHLVPKNEESLERFWADYKSGRLSSDFSRYLITEEMRAVAGQDVMIRVIMLEEQYRQWKGYLQLREKATGSQKPDAHSSVREHTPLTATSPLHRLIFKISQELTDKDVQIMKDQIRIDQTEDTMAPYEKLTNLPDIFKKLEADNHLGSDDDEKLTNTLELLDGLENFDRRYFEMDIENARVNVDFVGREKEMKNLGIDTDGDKTHVKIIDITGCPGVGKSTFAQQLCLEQSRREIFISLSKVTRVDNMLRLIMREFGVTDNIDGDGNTDVEATVAHLIGTYDGEDCSLLLDNADSLLKKPESRKFAGFLAKVQANQNPKVHVIVTSRSSIMSGPGQGDVPAIKSTSVNLKMLEESTGTDLVQGLVGKGNITRDEAREVYKRCKGWPLAITIACGMIRKEHLRPSESLIKDINNISDLLTAVVSSLGKDMLATLKLVSVFAGPFTVKSACTIIGQPDRQSRVWDHLRELRARRLIKAESHSIDGAVRYDTHDEVRTFMSTGTVATHAVTPEDMAAAKYRFMKLYEERLTTVAQDMQRNIHQAVYKYNNDVDNFNHFLALIQQETQEDYDWRKERDEQHTWLMDTKAEEVGDRSAVHILLEQMMVVKERISFYTGPAKRLKKQNTQIYAEMLCWLAETHLQENMQKDAWDRLEEARKALEARPDRKEESVQLSFARYHYVSGIYFSHRDDYKHNVRHLDQARDILSKAKMAGNHVLYARVVNSLGFAHHNHAKTKRGQEYLGLLQESLAMHKKAHDIIIGVVGQDNHFDCATYLMNIGVVNLDMGWHYKRARQATEADQAFNKALETFFDAERLVKAMRLEKQHNYGLLQYNMARCYEALGDLAEAVSRVQRAQEVLESIYDSHPDIADCLYFIGKLSKENNDPETARTYFKLSLEHNEGLGDRRNAYEWDRLKKAIMASCQEQEREWYRQRFEKIDGTPYREPLTAALAGFGGRMVARLLRPLHTFIKDVWTPYP
ncbi:PREDICTED: LOW QUALITY PROTEIN: uncharacterized protein LOC109478460 [Branchiostoma belcheri]|uniref:LOW QUALITY PROTEIN: uncharacterized protein LOC109478460 n=1 Tax=Branchiostoma belcheri TaxID=7741 RepID=A0A6P4ZFN4_BRABE|nr:PREDICTED: LOW QUALITY PROTEIN: uncharacterized protein LOC109478460 [Branchiostoma belcheri]